MTRTVRARRIVSCGIGVWAGVEDELAKRAQCAIVGCGRVFGPYGDGRVWALHCPTCGRTVRPMEYERFKAIEAGELRVSVQANEGMYCEPRDNNGVWSKVELGYPNRDITKIMPEFLDYCENKDEPTGTVYGYVPCELVTRLLKIMEGGKNAAK